MNTCTRKLHCAAHDTYDIIYSQDIMWFHMIRGLIIYFLFFLNKIIDQMEDEGINLVIIV
jgi:hypothetical protein